MLLSVLVISSCGDANSSDVESSKDDHSVISSQENSEEATTEDISEDISATESEDISEEAESKILYNADKEPAF